MHFSTTSSLITLIALTTAVTSKNIGLGVKGTNFTLGLDALQTGGNAATITVVLLPNSTNNPSKVSIHNDTKLWISERKDSSDPHPVGLSLDYSEPISTYGPKLCSYTWNHDDGDPAPPPTTGFSWGSDGTLKVSHKPFYGWVACGANYDSFWWAVTPITNLSSKCTQIDLVKLEFWRNSAIKGLFNWRKNVGIIRIYSLSIMPIFCYLPLSVRVQSVSTTLPH